MAHMTMTSHPVFKTKLIDLKSYSLAKLANKFLSLGGVSYYLFDEQHSTRVVLFNYFSLLAGGDFLAEWKVDLYSTEGERIFSKKGHFEKQEQAVVDLDDIRPASPYGIVVVYINTLNGGITMKQAYDSVFFTEHYSRNSPHHDIAHSLRWPTPVKHEYSITGHGFSFLPNATPFLLVGNSLNRAYNFPKHYSKPRIIAINSKGVSKIGSVELIPPMGCRKVDLVKTIPGLREHFGDEPGMIQIKGLNILRKPFFYQTDGKFISSDHL